MRDLEELFSNLNPLAQNFETPIVANDVKPVLQNSAPSFSYVADGNTWVPTNSPVAAGGNSATEDWSSFASEELSLIRVIIENDKAAEFESFLDESEVKNVEEGMLLAFAGCELCPYDILGKICHHRASNCANALLSHKVGKMMNLNIQNCYGSYPLYDAAITLSYILVDQLSCYFTMVRESNIYALQG